MIDESFIDVLSHDRDERKIIKATIEIRYTLGINVLAKGVESVEQLAYLHARGYLRSRAVPATEFSVLFESTSRQAT